MYVTYLTLQSTNARQTERHIVQKQENLKFGLLFSHKFRIIIYNW